MRALQPTQQQQQGPRRSTSTRAQGHVQSHASHRFCRPIVCLTWRAGGLCMSSAGHTCRQSPLRMLSRWCTRCSHGKCCWSSATKGYAPAPAHAYMHTYASASPSHMHVRAVIPDVLAPARKLLHPHTRTRLRCNSMARRLVCQGMYTCSAAVSVLTASPRAGARRVGSCNRSTATLPNRQSRSNL